MCYSGRVGPNTNRQPSTIAGKEEGGQKGIRLKVGTVNVDTMRGKCGDFAEMATRRLDLCCVQESRL